MVKIVERVQAHYENREMPFGKVYAWHPAYVTLECDCDKKVTLSATSATSTCGRCDTDLGTFIYELREREGRLPDKLTHPWFMMPGSGNNNTSMMRPLIPKARAGVTTILRLPPTRSEPKEKKVHASTTNR